MEEKKEIRKRIFKARKEHDDAWIQEKSHVITETLTKLPEYRNAERIMAYADYNHEVITRYMIEQAWKDGETVSWEDAMMIMPGVAFDEKCDRVGYGGGFYDRFLEKHPGICRVAVGFSFQILPEVPTEPTDIRPQVVVTEDKIYRDMQ